MAGESVHHEAVMDIGALLLYGGVLVESTNRILL